MSLTTVLFDLDGTLLPMDQDIFIKKYLACWRRNWHPTDITLRS